MLPCGTPPVSGGLDAEAVAREWQRFVVEAAQGAPCSVSSIAGADALEVDGAQPAGHWDGARVRLSHSRPQPLRLLTHELCHAWDSEHDWSARHPTVVDALPPVPGGALYPSARARQREAFARACALRDVDLSLARALHQPGAEAEQAVVDAVWPRTPRLPWRVRVAGRSRAPDVDLGAALGPRSRILAADACGAHLCVVVADARPPTDQDRFGIAFAAVDLTSFSVSFWRPLARAQPSGWSLLGGPHGALLLETGAETRGTWWTADDHWSGQPVATPPLRSEFTVTGSADAAHVTVDLDPIVRLPLQGAVAREAPPDAVQAPTVTAYGSVWPVSPDPAAPTEELAVLLPSGDRHTLALPPVRWPLWAGPDGSVLGVIQAPEGLVGVVSLDPARRRATVALRRESVPADATPVLAAGALWMLSADPPALWGLPRP